MAHPVRLEVVIRLRELAEDAAAGRLAVALTAHRVAASALTAAGERRLAETDRLDASLAGPTTGSDLSGAALRLAQADALVRRRTTELTLVAETLLRARRDLADATRRREIVVRLRDRLEASQRREADRREAIRLDDVVTARHGRELLGEVDR